MKRLVLLVAIAAVAAVGILYGLRRAERTPRAAIAALLPAGTVAFAHVPDFKRTREEWHNSDVYQLYQERAVQEFLKPLLKASQPDTTSETLNQVDQLEPKDAFVAVTSIENTNPHLVGGFRFHGSQGRAEKTIATWRPYLARDASVHEEVDYAKHKIDIVGRAPNQVATVYDGQWFFVSNDLAQLKAILDRADLPGKDPKTTLEADETFRAAMAHMPSSYAFFVYLQPKALSEGFAAGHNSTDAVASAQQAMILDQLRSVCATSRFDKGKIRDVLFVGTAKAPPNQELTRSSLKLGTADTFLYIAALLDPERLDGIGQTGTKVPLGSWFQKVFDVAARSGVTPNEWRAAFDLETGTLAEWPQTSHLPSIIATLPVRDPGRALKIVDALTKTIDEDVPWKKTEKGSVRYYYMQSPVAVFAITPTIAVSNQQTIVGLDSVSVEGAMTRSAKSSSSLAGSSVYKTASNAVPTPTTGFVYVDTALLYSRLDAALRPMLLMSAAFMPAVSDYVDVTKLPPPEVITRHLSPIVSSQRYDRDGYVTESTGPVTLDIGLGLPALGWVLSRPRR